MGHRANYVRILHRHVSTGTNKWGALAIPDCLLDHPPGEFIASIRRKDRLYDRVSCEGFVCVDCDQKIVLFDDGQSNIVCDRELNEIFYDRVGKSWAGWELFFVGRGRGEGTEVVERYIRYRSGDQTIPDIVAAAGFDGRADQNQLVAPAGLGYHRGDPHWKFVARVTLEDGTQQVFQFCGELYDLLGGGPGVFAMLPREQLVDLLPQDAQWRWSGGLRSAYIELDRPSRNIRFWESVPQFALVEWARRKWGKHGYSVRRLQDDAMTDDCNLRQPAFLDKRTIGNAVQRFEEKLAEPIWPIP